MFGCFRGLRGAKLPASHVLYTITESRAPSIRHLYTLKWGVFVKWCCDKNINLANCPVLDVLRLLQQRLDNGSLPSMLKIYEAAISVPWLMGS